MQILPYLGQMGLYQEFNFRQGIDSAANVTARQHRIASFLCPSTPSGSMSYAACHHDVEAPIDADNHGVFYLNSRTRYDDITDGPAFTILLGEAKSSTVLDAWAVGDRSTLRNTGTRIDGEYIRPSPSGFTVTSFENVDSKAAEEECLPVRTSAASAAATLAGPISFSATARSGSWFSRSIPLSTGDWAIGPTES